MVKGFVVDGTTNQPLISANVTLLCWYHAGWDKTDYKSIDMITDTIGCFEARFKKGYKVIAAAVTADHFPNLEVAPNIDSAIVNIIIPLKKRSQKMPTAKISLRDYIIQHDSD